MEENKKPLAEGEEKEEAVSKNFIEREIDKDLAEGVYDHVQTRFPPEPNGYLHIGHAKSIILNSGLAKEYNGKFNLRFDDTNPTKEKSEFVESIKADVKWLGADWEDRLFFASDYFDQICNLFDPYTIDDSYYGEDGEIPGIKTEDNRWNIKGHSHSEQAAYWQCHS